MSESLLVRESNVGLKNGVSPGTVGPNQRAWRRFRKNRPAISSLWFLLLVGLFILIYPIFSPFQPEQLSDAQFRPPNQQHWLGTDVHGRDLLIRLCYGAQISLMVGVFGA